MRPWILVSVALVGCGGGGDGAEDARPMSDAPPVDAAAIDAAAAVLHCGTISADETWDASAPHLVTCDVIVEGAGAPTLTIADDAQVAFDADAGLSIGAAMPGRLVLGGATLTSSAAVPAAGDWDGVTLGAMSGDSTITDATIAYGGGIRVEGAAAPAIRESVIRDNAGDGVAIADTADLGNWFASNVVTGNAGHAVSAPARVVRWLDLSSTYAGNGGAIRITGGVADQTGTWRALDADYLVDGHIVIGGSTQPVITIAGGATLRFNGLFQLQVGGGASDPGGLVVDGGADPVLFTSAQAAPQPGDWHSLAFSTNALAATSQLRGLTLEYGGGGPVYTSQLQLQGNDLVVDGVESRHSALSGMSVEIGATATITDSTFRDNATYGLSVGDTSTLATFSGNTMTGNAAPIRLYASSVGDLDATSTFDGTIEIAGGTVTETATWRDLGAGYYVASTPTIAGTDDPVVTIEAGASLAFSTMNGAVGIIVGSTATNGKGGLIAQGVTFTRAGTTGNWAGLRFLTFCIDASTILDEVIVEHGGGSATYPGSIYSSGCAGTISDSTVRDSARWGIYTVGADPTITNVTYANNASGDLF